MQLPTLAAWAWIPIVIGAAMAQTFRNAAQRSLTAEVGTLPATLVRDAGAIVNLEFDYPLERNTSTGAQVNLIPFVDHGRARNVGGPVSTLASAGLAARVQLMRLHIDLAVAKRLRTSDAPTASSPSRLQDAGIHLQVAYRF